MLAEKKKGIKNMSKANLKSYHWETVNDVDFFTNGVVCTDINVKDTVRQLCFQHRVIDIDRDNKKVFTSVEEICINPEVSRTGCFLMSKTLSLTQKCLRAESI